MTTQSNIEVLRIKKMATTDMMSWCKQIQTPNKYLNTFMENSEENIHVDIWALRVNMDNDHCLDWH